MEKRMRQSENSWSKFSWGNVSKLAAVGLMLTLWCSIPSAAQQRGQKTFSSPEEASNTLFTAMQSNDEKALLEILGPDAKQIVSSGDEAEDSNNRAMFVKKYQELHRLVTEPDKTVTLYIGAENWPTPIPLVDKGTVWYFDTDAAKKEILFRRIGRNEMSTIVVCRQLVAAEKEYSSQHGEYAQKIFSDEGQHDGLYWKTAGEEAKSPVGPLVASAFVEGSVKAPDGAPTPFRGYYFHILTRQGKNASGGAKNYIVNGKLTDGFAFVAYPAEYRSSGVVTFVVDADGTVYQKDLGKKTEAHAKGMKDYNPDSTWQKIEEATEGTTADQKTQ
jgi:hypothetical protein